MSTATDLQRAKAWCDEARALLGLARYSKSGRADIKDRVSKILSELRKLDQGVQAGTFGIEAAVVNDFVARFLAMSAALNAAARTQDHAEVERQSKRLSELKKQLAVRMADSKGARQAAQQKLDARGTANAEMNAYVDARDAAWQRVSMLRLHEQAAAIDDDLTDIETRLLGAAKTSADAGAYPPAMALLAQAAAACDAAQRIADAGIEYAEHHQRAQLALNAARQHPQSSAAATELQQANQKLAEAATLTRGGQRAYGRAGGLLGEAEALCKQAVEVADRSARYQTARAGANSAMANVAKHAQATVLTPELDALDLQLTRADELASPDRRDFDAAMSELQAIHSAAAAAHQMAERCLAYVNERARVEQQLQSCRRHAQSQAAEPECQQADALLASAAKLASPETRDHVAARGAVQQAGDLLQTGLGHAQRCQEAVDARAEVMPLILDLQPLRKLGKGVDDAIIAIESRLSQADVLAAVTVRDYAGACALYLQLPGECAAAQAQAHETDWLQSQAQAQSDVLKALAAQGPDRTRLEGLWAVAQELANGGEHARALQVLGKVRALVITEMKSTPPAQLGDDVAHRIAALEEDGRVGEALRACHAFVKGPLQAVIDLAKPLGDSAPKEWAELTKRVATSLSLDHDTPLTAINDALAQAREALKVHEQAVRKLLADRDAWLKRWAAFEVEHQSLAKHPGVVAQATLLSAITGIVDDGQKAKLDADKLVFTPEPDALSALMLRLKDVREHADAASRYLTMRQARQIAVNAVNADLHQAEANKSRKAAADCLLEAQKLAVSKDYKNAEAQLQRIPDLLHKAWQQSQAQQNYDYWLDEYKTKIFDAVDKLDDKYKKHLGVELDPLRAALAQADTHAKAPDIIRAALVMGELGKLAAAARSMADAVVDYVDKRDLFDSEFKKFDGHAGLEGVQAFYDAAKADRDYADTAVLNREFSLASSVLEALQPKLEPQRLLADRYIPYKEKKTKVRQALDEVGRQTDAEGAATERAQAERYMTLAEQQQAAASARAEVALLDAADASLDAAQLQVDAAKSALSALKSFQGDPPAGEGLALLQARLQALPGRRQAVKAQGGDAFDPLIAPVENAEKALAQALAADSPDLAAAGLALDQAEKTLADAFAKALRKGGYDTLLPTVETLIKTTLPGLNNAPTDCLDKEIEELNRQLEEAKRQAQAPMLDFPSAMKTLNGAKVLADRALKKHEIFGLMQSELDAMKQLAEDLDKDPYKIGLDRELKRVRDLRAAIDKDLAAFNFPAAQKKAQAGAALDSPFRKLMTGYDQAVAARKTIYDTLKDELEGKPAAKVEFDMLTALRPNYDKIIDVDHVFAAAAKTVAHFNFYIDVARRALLRHEEYVTARKVQTDRLDVLKPQSNPGVQAAIEAAERTIERADALDLTRDFKQAQIELEPLKAKFDAIELDIPRYNAFHAARETARQRVAEARQHAQAGFIEPLMLMADAKIRQAEAAAQRGEFKTAEDLCKEVPGDCDAAKSEADLYQPFTSGSAAGDDLKGLEEALKKVRLQWAELHTGRNADQELPERIVEASRQIKLAEKALPDQPAQAREHIEKAAADCAQARLHRLQFAQFLAASQKLVDEVEAFRTGTHKSAAFVDGRMKDLLPRIGAARSVMTAQGAQAAADALNDCTATYREHVALADRHLAYAQRRLGLEPEGQPTVLDEFEGHAQRHALAGDIADLRAALDEAAQAAEPTQPDLGRAMAALERAEGAAAAARLAIHMHTNPAPPDVKEVAKVLGQPKGAERLDALVAQLEPNARREVLQAAFEVRFGCKLALYKDGAEDTADAELGVDVARLYRDFAKLPPKHTLKNDSLLAVHDRRDATGYSGEGGASDFVPSTKELNMREGTASTSAGRNLGSAFALGKVQDGCEPENDEPVQFFDWNTLHEVGHTVEDRHQFMAARMGDKSYGGWTEYGGDLHAVAEKVVAKFKYDLEYTQALLAGETDPPLPDPPEKPQPVTAEVWEQRRMATLIWVKKAKFGTDPWETEATAQALKLEGEEIIHEAYDGYWYGYDAGARSQGLTGYQFRSPVEWFSEIYAAYYMKKLKPSHPATVWLKKLHKQ